MVDLIDAVCNTNQRSELRLNYDALCECLCALEDHHLSFFPGGGMFAEECEAFGGNEVGGMIFIDGKWLDHCHKFRLLPGQEIMLP